MGPSIENTYIQLSYSTNSKAANFQLQFYDEEQLNNDEIKCLNKNQIMMKLIHLRFITVKIEEKEFVSKGNSIRKSIDENL